MADMSERGRMGGGRRRRPRGGPSGRGERKDRDYDVDTAPTSRPTIILAKHADTEQSGSSRRSTSSTSPAPQSRQAEKPVMVIKPREDSIRTLTPASSLPSIPVSTMQGETPPQQTFLHRPNMDGSNKLGIPQEMSKCTKLIDEHNSWCETSHDLLLDQPDFLVVGVVGMQGCGKSTILSLLAGNSPQDSNRSFVFPPQSREVREECGHMTSGVDIYVTSQRIILLDAQPMLSASVLDQLIHNEKKIPPEYSTAENFAEVQCLQMLTFLLTVCNVVLVVQDWFLDMALMRLLQTAEMLKPSTPSSSQHETSTGQDDQPDFFPHIVFVQNKAGREDFSVESFTGMQETLNSIFNSSKLKMKDDVTMATGRQTFGLNPTFTKSNLNLFLLPVMDNETQETSESVLTQMPEYRGYPSFNTLMASLRSQIFAMPREPHTHTTLSEKKWFHYAARIWDSIRKSPLIAEYNRLLP